MEVMKKLGSHIAKVSNWQFQMIQSIIIVAVNPTEVSN